jgi:hypothetical protein
MRMKFNIYLKIALPFMLLTIMLMTNLSSKLNKTITRPHINIKVANNRESFSLSNSTDYTQNFKIYYSSYKMRMMW